MHAAILGMFCKAARGGRTLSHFLFDHSTAHPAAAGHADMLAHREAQRFGVSARRARRIPLLARESEVSCLPAISRPAGKSGEQRGPRAPMAFSLCPRTSSCHRRAQAEQLARLQDVRHRIGSITGQAMHSAIRCLPSSRYSWPSSDHGSPDLHDNSVTPKDLPTCRPCHPCRPPSAYSHSAHSRIPGRTCRIFILPRCAAQDQGNKDAQTLHACYSDPRTQ